MRVQGCESPDKLTAHAFPASRISGRVVDWTANAALQMPRMWPWFLYALAVRKYPEPQHRIKIEVCSLMSKEFVKPLNIQIHLLVILIIKFASSLLWQVKPDRSLKYHSKPDKLQSF